jgi:hypothetical protein
MNNKLFERIDNNAYIYLDELGNVVYESDFTIILGKIDESYRFIPKSNVTLEQGLTAQMMTIISNLIKRKAGIGEKRAEPIFENGN